MKNYATLSCLLLLVPACSNTQSEGEAAASAAASRLVQTQVISPSSAATSKEEWGSAATYFEGETAGLADLLSGTATIDPGLEIHPPHRHAEEEFLMVLEGTGEWTVRDRKFTAGEGDMLYAAAWDLHGIRNTGEVPLRFVFWKAHPKGLSVPPNPIPGQD